MPEIYLKREDLNHTGAHKINNSLGQALLCKRMNKKRIIAETGAGQHGVATVREGGVGGLMGTLCMQVGGPVGRLQCEGWWARCACSVRAGGHTVRAGWRTGGHVVHAGGRAGGHTAVWLRGLGANCSAIQPPTQPALCPARPFPCPAYGALCCPNCAACPFACLLGCRPQCAPFSALSASSTWGPR